MTKRKLDRLAEKIRKANSGDSAYQHLLDTIADGIEKEFSYEEDATVRVMCITNFVRRFKP